MEQYITVTSKLAEYRMLYGTKQILTLAVEGETDELVLRQFFDKHMVRIEPKKGYENVLKIIKEANLSNNEYIIGLIDKDYHTICEETGHKIGCVRNVIYTDFHDIEIVLFESAAYDKYLKVLAKEYLIETIKEPRIFIYEIASCIGALRLLSLRQEMNLYFDGIDYKKFIDKKTGRIDELSLIEHVVNRSRCQRGITIDKTNEEILIELQKIKEERYDYRIICNGHDVLNILALLMHKRFSSVDTDEDRIFKELLLAFTESDFHRTILANDLLVWLQHNPPPPVTKSPTIDPRISYACSIQVR